MTSCARSAAATGSWASSSRRLSCAPSATDDATPLSTLVAHVRHAAEVAGIDHVGLGSDFDGAPMPAAIADVSALPRLLAELRDDGFSADEVQRIAWGNWRRVLEAAWGV
jgi:membrane dipeptidase